MTRKENRMTLKEKLDKINNSLNGLINNESPTELIAQIGDLKNEVASIEEDFNKLEKDHQATKDKLVEVVKGTSFSKPEDDDTGIEPKSLDDILKDELVKVKKKEN